MRGTRSIRTGSVLALSLAGVLALIGCGTTQPAEPIGEPGAYLGDFDTAWELVRDTHFDEDYNGVDWQGVRDELRPKAEQNRTLSQSRALINEMVSRLGQSHFGVIPEAVDPNAIVEDTSGPVEFNGDGAGQGDLGITVRVVEGHATVTHIRASSPADEAGVRTGWIIDAVRGRQIKPIIASMTEAFGPESGALYIKQALDGMLNGSIGSSVPVTFLDANDLARELVLTRVDPPGRMVKFGNLPAISTHLSHRWLTPEEVGSDARIGYIAFNIFMIPIMPQFEAAMVEYQDADGLIIDLRGNPGGVGALAGALSRFLVSEKQNLGVMQMRGAKLEFNAEPVAITSTGELLDPFTGPVAVLQDGTSASTSEIWAGGLRAIKRAEVFGERSAGMALPAAMTKLPSGDVLLHAIADYTNSDGTRLEGDGVPVDHPVTLTRRDLLDGIDAPLQAAATWIVERTN